MLTIAKNIEKNLVKLGQCLLAEGIDGRGMLVLRFPVKTPESQTGEILSLDHLTALVGLGIDHIPKQFGTHRQILVF